MTSSFNISGGADKQDEAGRQLETVHQGGAKTSTTFSSSGAQE